MPQIGLSLTLPTEVGDTIISVGAGSLLLESGSFFLMEDGSSHLIFE